MGASSPPLLRHPQPLPEQFLISTGGSPLLSAISAAAAAAAAAVAAAAAAGGEGRAAGTGGAQPVTSASNDPSSWAGCCSSLNRKFDDIFATIFGCFLLEKREVVKLRA
jgi:hypothetical protein